MHLMCEYADEAWCAVSAPVVQSLLVGLGVAAVGLAFFPFTVDLVRPLKGDQLSYRTATTAVAWGRRISWPLVLLASVTLAGYVVVYVRAHGRFCDAVIDQTTRRILCGWTFVATLTFVVLALLAILRHRASRASASG